MTLLSSPIDWSGHVPAPPRLPNGGLYTGALATGSWGNVPVAPDAAAHVRFMAAVQPPGAVGQQLPVARPGSAVPALYRQPVGDDFPDQLCFTPPAAQ